MRKAYLEKCKEYKLSLPKDEKISEDRFFSICASQALTEKDEDGNMTSKWELIKKAANVSGFDKSTATMDAALRPAVCRDREIYHAVLDLCKSYRDAEMSCAQMVEIATAIETAKREYSSEMHCINSALIAKFTRRVDSIISG